MRLKEKIAYALGFVIVIYGAFVGRDFTNFDDVMEGVLMILLFIGLFLVFVYINKRGFGDWNPYQVKEHQIIDACTIANPQDV